MDSILGFYIDLPVKRYSPAEFLEAVTREGEKQLQKHLEQQREERQERKEREEKQKALDSIAEKIKEAIGLHD